MKIKRMNTKIIIIGAGGIVQAAHLPAYKIAGFFVAGIFDIDFAKASMVAKNFDVAKVYPSLEDAVSDSDSKTVFDIALPAAEILPVLEKLPGGSVILLQKPMGENLQQAHAINNICKQKKFVAGINFQLRYAPFILKAKELIHKGTLGDITDVEIKINTFTPWHLWPFLKGMERVEILYHSIHYIDLVRNLLGNPNKISAKTIRHPGPTVKALASVRSLINMDYGEYLWANIITNHCHNYGNRHQQSYIKIEGTKGAIYIKMGLLLNYPQGEPDVFEYTTLDEKGAQEWQSIAIDGTWFPHAFIGSMAEMIKALNTGNYKPDNSVEDCLQTMAWVEAAYESAAKEGVVVKKIKLVT